MGARVSRVGDADSVGPWLGGELAVVDGGPVGVERQESAVFFATVVPRVDHLEQAVILERGRRRVVVSVVPACDLEGVDVLLKDGPDYRVEVVPG
jgi:hypothetical protein